MDEHERVEVQYQLDKEEDRIVEEVKEWLLNNERIHRHILNKIKGYVEEPYGIKVDEPKTEIQEELVCQWQVQIMNQILAKVMLS